MMTKNDAIRMTHAEWITKAENRFGKDARLWAFKCPSCGHVATVAEYKAAGAKEGQVGFNCIGRHSGGDEAAAARIEAAVAKVLADGCRGADLGGNMGTAELGDAVVSALKNLVIRIRE